MLDLPTLKLIFGCVVLIGLLVCVYILQKNADSINVIDDGNEGE